MTVHPKKIRFIENIILTLISLIVLFITIYTTNLKEYLETKNFKELISASFIMLIYVGLIYKFWNPKFLSFEKTIFEENFTNNSLQFENNVFILADFKIEKKKTI